MTESVLIDSNAVNQYARKLAQGKNASAKHWILDDAYFSPRILSLDTERKLLFFFVFNLLSFSYWGKPKWSVETEQGMMDGSFAMSHVLLNAIHAGLGTTTAWKDLSFSDFRELMSSPIAEIPLLEKRFDIIHSTFGILADRNVSILGLLHASAGNVSQFVDSLHDMMPAFRDESFYAGESVYFLKKAQLFAADCFYMTKGNDACLKNIDALTACADYKLPQLLKSLEILQYEQSLLKRINRGDLLEQDSQEEIAIRAATIVAVDEILLLMNELNPVRINAMELNNMLWTSSQEIQRDMHPYHLVRTVKY